jgi:hypothetical protein
MRVLWVALALGWASDLLFYGQSIGISVPLFALLLLGSIQRFAGKAEQVETNKQWQNWQAFHLSNWEANSRLKDLQRVGVLCCEAVATSSQASQVRRLSMWAN